MSSSASSLGTLTPIKLTGVSQYSNDLQSVLNRAVAIAQIPITALQNRDSTILGRESALGQLQSAVHGLAGSISSLGTLARAQALSASSSDSTVVSATDTGATAPASYTINSITSIASAASEHSLAKYADANSTQVSSTGKMELVVGSNTYPITLSANNLSAVANQINLLDAGVTASILTTASGNYLSVSANSTGSTTLQIIDDPGGSGHANRQWLTSANQGSDAVFQLNGITVDQASNTVNNVIAGLTFNILDTTSTPVTLSLQSDPAQVTSALQTLVTNYNSVLTALNAQEGPTAGALSGDSTIMELQSAINRLAGFTSGAGSVRSLSDLGISFASNGQASFDPTAISGFSDAQLSAAFSFIGSTTAGLVGAGQDFQQFSDPVNGLIQAEAKGLGQTDQSLQSQIATLTNQLTVMQTNLASQLQGADSLIAELESQQTQLSATLQGLNLVLYGKNMTSL